jgi:hypothetical protein
VAKIVKWITSLAAVGALAAACGSAGTSRTAAVTHAVNSEAPSAVCGGWASAKATLAKYLTADRLLRPTIATDVTTVVTGMAGWAHEAGGRWSGPADAIKASWSSTQTFDPTAGVALDADCR